ncbi:MAG: phosphate acyltransferase PlsX [Alphaproteobacteria bacterium]
MTSPKYHNLIIALDAMGGDHAPTSVIEGAEIALENYSELNFKIYGNEELISPLLNKYKKVKNSSIIIHTDKSISPTTKPSVALRNGRDSSMGLAIKAVKDKEASACVSSGNTGALMAISKILLRTLPNISRPAIATLIPTLKGKLVMLDLGANSICDANNLFEFAIMGDAFAKVILEKETPTIGLLNIGSEDEKGNEVVKDAGNMLKNLQNGFKFYGYIEGNDIAEGIVDVVVTDGFSGNIALKTAEGTAHLCKEFMKRAFNNSIFAKIGYLLAKTSLKKIFTHIDARRYNGAMFLGLNGIIIKSHGSSDSAGFANAIFVAAELAANNINEKIISELDLSGHLNGNDKNDN